MKVFITLCFRFCVGLGLLAVFSAQVQALERPRDRVVLTISGQIGVSNQGGAAVFDMAMLEALPQHRFATRTPWEPGVVRFSGPLLRDVLALVQARGQRLHATALNDYRITLPLQDARDFDVIIATRMNEQPMPVRTRGPLFVIYPFDSDPQLQHARFYERSIWQLRSIEVIE
ncbi:molybdopterin-dependent oxidoreductase [Serpentinimonas raichei]|uniref:molybdopterin-dependent oxidoreductase n=1 Tax=Serpentinimonas raichei TaxID=1458425 RepID=UPI0009E2B42C|nr:molybdopterin-dependent oxidoreductase [Serpentinimonas raichei]